MPPSSRAAWNPGRVLVALRERARDTKPLLAQIGTMLAERCRLAFQQQRRGNVRWKGRRVPNIAGIVSDLREGKHPPLRRLDPRPALVDTGRLRDSITWRQTKTDTVEVGTNDPRAALHQFGGESKQTVTDAVKAGVRRLLRQSPWKDFDVELEALLRPEVKTWTTQVPARPFIAVTDEDRKDIQRLVVLAWTGVTKGTFARGGSPSRARGTRP